MWYIIRLSAVAIIIMPHPKIGSMLKLIFKFHVIVFDGKSIGIRLCLTSLNDVLFIRQEIMQIILLKKYYFEDMWTSIQYKNPSTNLF